MIFSPPVLSVSHTSKQTLSLSSNDPLLKIEMQMISSLKSKYPLLSSSKLSNKASPQSSKLGLKFLMYSKNSNLEIPMSISPYMF